VSINPSAMTSCLAEKSRGDVAHVRLFELVVLAVHAVDTDVFECSDDGWDVEAHGDESVNEVFVIPVIPGSWSAYAIQLSIRDTIFGALLGL
jgi:hypothetical protein